VRQSSLVNIHLLYYTGCDESLQGDLGAIDEQYDQAVSTSCGSLDNIVCETVESCQQVLAEVKRANVGRVYLMALDQMGQYLKYCDRPRNTPGGLPR
jgi:Chromosome segregation ATPases